MTGGPIFFLLHFCPPDQNDARTEEEEDEEEEFLLDEDGSPSQAGGLSLSMHAGSSYYLGGEAADSAAPAPAAAAAAPASTSITTSSSSSSAATDALSFAHEVHELVVSGYASRHPVANILLEVKAFKFAQNRSFASVVRAAVPALLDLALDPEVVDRQAAADAAAEGDGNNRRGGGGGSGSGSKAAGGGEAAGAAGAGAGNNGPVVVLSDKAALANVEAQLEYWDALLTVRGRGGVREWGLEGYGLIPRGLADCPTDLTLKINHPLN